MAKIMKRATRAGRSETSRSVPQYALPGRVRGARWNGGPIEAAKAFLSGQHYMCHPDSVYAYANWYSEETIDLLKEACANWVLLTWSGGFSLRAEENQRRIVSDHLRKCRENGIHVTAYMSMVNVLSKEMLEGAPQSKDWVQIDAEGNLVTYSAALRSEGATWSIACLNHPDWLAYLLRRVDSALEAGFDGIEYCGHASICHCDRCKEGFRRFTEDFIGRKLEAPTEASLSGKKDEARLLRLVYTRYQQSICERIYSTVCEHARRIKPDISLYGNLNADYGVSSFTGAISRPNSIEPGVVNGELACNIGLLRSLRAVHKVQIPTRIECACGGAEGASVKSIKYQLSIAEAAAHGVLFQVAPEGLFLSQLFFKTPEGMETWEAIAGYNRFLAENEDLYIEAEQEAQVAVFVNADLRDDDSIRKGRFLTGLAKNKIIFDVITDASLTAEHLKHYRALILPGTKYLSDDKAKLIANFAQGAGKVIAFGQAGCYDERFRKRSESVLKGVENVVWLKDPVLLTSKESEGEVGRLDAGIEEEALGQIVSAVSQASGEPLISVEAPEYVLHNVMYQSAPGRYVVHLLNYSDEVVRDVRVHASFPIASKEILSPDETKLRIKMSADSITIAQLKVYCVLALEPEDVEVEETHRPPSIETARPGSPMEANPPRREAPPEEDATAIEQREAPEAKEPATIGGDQSNASESVDVVTPETASGSASVRALPEDERRSAARRYRSSKVILPRERKKEDRGTPKADHEKIERKDADNEKRDEAQKLIDELFDSEDYPDKDLVRRILNCGDEIVPKLIEIVEAADDLQWEDSRGGGWTPVHAVKMLGEMRAADAAAPTIDLLHHGTPDELQEEIIVSLIKIGPPADDMLTQILLNKHQDYTARCAAATVLVYTTLFHHGTKKPLLRIFRDMLGDEDEDARILGALASDLCDIRALELYDDLMRAYKEGRLSSDFVRANDIEKMRDKEDIEHYCTPYILGKIVGGLMEDNDAGVGEAFLELMDDLAGKEGLMEFLYRTPLTRFALPDGFDYGDEDDDFPPAPIPEEPKPILAEPKVGRNEPCPCGSGKKYKKCCMGK